MSHRVVVSVVRLLSRKAPDWMVVGTGNVDKEVDWLVKWSLKARSCDNTLPTGLLRPWDVLKSPRLPRTIDHIHSVYTEGVSTFSFLTKKLVVHWLASKLPPLSLLIRKARVCVCVFFLRQAIDYVTPYPKNSFISRTKLHQFRCFSSELGLRALKWKPQYNYKSTWT